VEVQGHRGARAIYPENTMIGFEYALSAGADVLELDVVVTKDDAVVVTHDPVVNGEICLGANGQRITSPLAIRTLTIEQVRALDCGTLPNPRFPRQKRVPKARIPTLEEVLLLAKKHPKARLNIETKIEPAHPELTPPPDRFAELVVDLVAKHGMIERSVIQSFDRRTLIAAKKRAPKVTTAQLTGENAIDFVAAVKAIGADILSPNHEWITKEDVDALHRAGIRVVPWTANDEATWARLIAIGVDGIITDDPAALKSYLRNKKVPPPQ
jgi:glycerophosphoryl diester phosphodiesterase